MAKRIKIRIETGADRGQYVYQVPGCGNAKACPRFKTEAEREAHREAIRRRDYLRKAHESRSELHTVLTFDDAYRAHTFEEARRIVENYRRRGLGCWAGANARMTVTERVKLRQDRMFWKWAAM